MFNEVSPDTTIALSPMAVSLVVGMIIPILTAVATKLKSSTGVKAVAALVLSVILGVLVALVQAGPVTVDSLFKSVGTVFVANFVSYQGIWKPIGKTDRVPLAGLTKDVGFGKVVDGNQ